MPISYVYSTRAKTSSSFRSYFSMSSPAAGPDLIESMDTWQSRTMEEMNGILSASASSCLRMASTHDSSGT